MIVRDLCLCNTSIGMKTEERIPKILFRAQTFILSKVNVEAATAELLTFNGQFQ